MCQGELQAIYFLYCFLKVIKYAMDVKKHRVTVNTRIMIALAILLLIGASAEKTGTLANAINPLTVSLLAEGGPIGI